MTVYFARAGEDGPVKIGYAKHVLNRLCQIQSYNPERISLIRRVEGGLMEERLFHWYFRARHIRGEWFEFHESMLTISLRDTKAHLPDPVPVFRVKTDFTDEITEQLCTLPLETMT